MNVDTAVDTLQSMFMLVDREVLRLVLMEQCQGNLDNAVETLLAMQSSSAPQGYTQAVPSQQASNSSLKASTSPSMVARRAYKANESILYDDNMRPIIMTDDFLQPPSFYLATYYGLNAAQIENLQIQQRAQSEVEKELTRRRQTQQSAPREISLDASIVGQWTQLLKKYKFKDMQTMERVRDEMECKALNRCGSLVRVIFMMKLYQRLCNESGSDMNDKSGYLMHAYLSRGFKEYSLTQLINDCNHITQYHKFGGDALKSMLDMTERNKMENAMRSYFGHCDVMHCKIIQRICGRQDESNQENKGDAKQVSDIEVEQDIVDKYHRVFFHPLN